MKVSELLNVFENTSCQYKIIFYNNDIEHYIIIPKSETVYLLYGDKNIKSFKIEKNDFVIKLKEDPIVTAGAVGDYKQPTIGFKD